MYRYNEHSREIAICNRSETSKFAKGRLEMLAFTILYRSKFIWRIRTPTKCAAFWRWGLKGYKNKNRSSKKEHKENALALGADERRGKLRKASGRRKQPSIRRYLNGETCLSKPQVSMRESIAYGRERCELKHLSSSRRRKKTRFPK